MHATARTGRSGRARLNRLTRLPRYHRLSAAGLAAVGVTAATFALIPGQAQAADHGQELPAKSAAWNRSAPAGQDAQDVLRQADLVAHHARDEAAARKAAESGPAAGADADKAVASAKDRDARRPADRDATRADSAGKGAGREDTARKGTPRKGAAEDGGRDAHRERGRGGEHRPAGRKAYADNLDGWIRQALDIMKSKGIPGSYEGIHRNVMRESRGDVRAINDWDINARNGVPSKGLLQVIPPTFTAYHVAGTSWDIYDPVANITAACNYAAHRYGTIDNVDSAY
ncbi:transglycosylase SLT domain-containing protein [Streptomyces sp. B1866]|uniref:transglycosylase SLT domain-containing protein n=1 Tax=Streptomyces sp. B1866 TaxID=3075431 RepID=UPI0028915F02|nr:transglycosylase SLT domain-containing protein [Streptomyces sp. B1866]MDT3399232.1 transglycosylase SLT domain-containing protein [Streptomyces sp. B1866]